MSASIYWQAQSHQTSLYTLAPQAFLESLRAAGIGEVLDEADLPALQGMACVHGGVDHKNPYRQLIKAIERHGTVLLKVEY